MIVMLIGGPLDGKKIKVSVLKDTFAILPENSPDGVAFRYNRAGDAYQFVAYIMPVPRHNRVG